MLKSLSLIIPCNNEQDAIKISLKIYMEIIYRLIQSKIISEYEVIIVNNGSTDNTLNVLKEEKLKYNIQIINLQKNYGYTASYLAGMYHAKNEMIITVSADLHEDPDKIEELISKHYKTGKPVLGIYKKRHDTYLKNFFSNNYYQFMKLLGIKIINSHADFRLITSEINSNFFQNLNSFVFIRIKILDYIDSYEEIFYVGNNRKIGKTKFNFISSSLLAIDTILFYGKSLIKKLLIFFTSFSWLYTLIYSYLFNNIKFITIFFIISLLISLFYFFIHIKIRVLENKKIHFQVKEIL